jgi:hypothetical protein
MAGSSPLPSRRFCIARVAERAVYINNPIGDNRAIKEAPRKIQAVHLTQSETTTTTLEIKCLTIGHAREYNE